MDNQLIDELRTELHGLDARLVSLDRELQDQKRPWFKDMSSVVALLAFAFSLLTTTIAFRRDKIQDQHNLRAELRGIIEKLNELPARNVENFVKYKADDGVPQTLSGFLNQENSTLSRQASDIMTQLPGDQVSAADYIALAQSEQSNRDFGAAIANLEKASALSGNLDDRVGSLRMLANLRFITGNPQSDAISTKRRQPYSRTRQVMIPTRSPIRIS